MNKQEKNKLILDNLSLVHKVARNLNIKWDYEDKFQEGVIGLIKAIDMYNPKKCREFSTYAYTCIRATILRGYQSKGNFIRIPEGMYGQYFKLNRVKGFDEMNYDGDYDYEYLSKETGLSIERIKLLIELFNMYQIDIKPYEEAIPYSKDLDHQLDCINTINYIKRKATNYSQKQKDNFIKVFLNGERMDELKANNSIFLFRKKLRQLFKGVPECIR